MQRTAEHGGQFVRISFLGLAIFAIGGLPGSTVCCEEKPPTNNTSTAAKGISWSLERKVPTHHFVRTIGVTDSESPRVSVNSFCLDSKGNLLAACTGKVSKGSIRIVSLKGKLLKTGALDFVPQAINRAADGTIYVAGSGKVARLDADGKVIQEVNLPSDDIKPPPPEEEKRLQDELKKLQADNDRLLSECREMRLRLVKVEREWDDARNDSKSAVTDKEQDYADERIEMAALKQKNTQAKLDAKNSEAFESSLVMQKIRSKLGISNNHGTVTGIAATKRDLFICRLPHVDYDYEVRRTDHDFSFICPWPHVACDYEVWRTDHDFSNPKKIITGLVGRYGQMDIQADDQDLWIAENGRHLVHRYDRDGKKLSSFGKNDRSAIDGFGGFCDPKNIRVLGDEIFTAESTEPGQIKHFTKDGRFLEIVAAPTYATGLRVCLEVSADKKQIFCLNPARNAIYVFE